MGSIMTVIIVVLVIALCVLFAKFTDSMTKTYDAFVTKVGLNEEAVTLSEQLSIIEAPAREGVISNWVEEHGDKTYAILMNDDGRVVADAWGAGTHQSSLRGKIIKDLQKRGRKKSKPIEKALNKLTLGEARSIDIVTSFGDENYLTAAASVPGVSVCLLLGKRMQGERPGQSPSAKGRRVQLAKLLHEGAVDKAPQSVKLQELEGSPSKNHALKYYCEAIETCCY
jgi:hypothetical protein